jgi:hypothetical protein
MQVLFPNGRQGIRSGIYQNADSKMEGHRVPHRIIHGNTDSNKQEEVDNGIQVSCEECGPSLRSWTSEKGLRG